MVCNEVPVRAGQYVYSTLRLKPPVATASSPRTSRAAKMPWLWAASPERTAKTSWLCAASANTKSARRGDYELKELKQLEPAMWLRVQKRYSGQTPDRALPGVVHKSDYKNYSGKTPDRAFPGVVLVTITIAIVTIIK